MLAQKLRHLVRRQFERPVEVNAVKQHRGALRRERRRRTRPRHPRHDTYAGGDQIDAVSDVVTLNVRRLDLIRAESTTA
jgi:hypothetical protein